MWNLSLVMSTMGKECSQISCTTCMWCIFTPTRRFLTPLTFVNWQMDISTVTVKILCCWILKPEPDACRYERSRWTEILFQTGTFFCGIKKQLLALLGINLTSPVTTNVLNSVQLCDTATLKAVSATIFAASTSFWLETFPWEDSSWRIC